jgi:hypothetical protein
VHAANSKLQATKTKSASPPPIQTFHWFSHELGVAAARFGLARRSADRRSQTARGTRAASFAWAEKPDHDDRGTMARHSEYRKQLSLFFSTRRIALRARRWSKIFAHAASSPTIARILS